MEIASIRFVALTAIGAILFFCSSQTEWRRIVLLGVSLAFLASFGQPYWAVWPAAIFCVVSVVGILMVSAYRETAIPVLAALLGIFLILKGYLPLGVHSNTLVVVGISYILFRTLQVILDLRDEAIGRETVTIPDILLFLLSFLTLSAGPIQRYQDFFAQLSASSALRVRDIDIQYVAGRTVFGLLKLVVLAPLVQSFYQSALEIESVSVRLGLAASAFMLWIYVNFSGYMDVMIGIGRIFGFKLPENFNRPDRSVNFLDIWSRWHITLSRTFLTYIFNPLVRHFMQRSPGNPVLAGIMAYLIVFFLIGCWHGPGLQFALSGVIFGLAAASTRAWQSLRQRGTLTQFEFPGSAILSGGFALGVCAVALIPTWPLFTSAPEVLGAFRSPGRVIGVIAVATAAGVVARLAGIAFDAISRKILGGGEEFALVRHPAVVAAISALILLSQLSASDQFSAIVYYQRF